MQLEQALQEAMKGKLFGRLCWSTSKVLCLDVGVRVDDTIQLHGEVVHPLQDGRPPYRLTPEDRAATDWSTFE
nr:hypothetical protein [uncultured Pseudogulbenkiania sp.]